MEVRLVPLVVGVASYIPGFPLLTARRTGGSISARYCYSVWLRHLWWLKINGLGTQFKVMAELGPGDSLGLGLAALLSGVCHYVALDTIRYANVVSNLQIFDELVELFHKRAAIPDENEFPLVFPRLPNYQFPNDILTDDFLQVMLDPARLANIRASLREPCTGGPISYIAPWKISDVPAGSVDLIVSQTVLQNPIDLQSIYAALNRWLCPGGVMSHEIDFKSLGRTRSWNGHWTCSNLTWALVQGRRRSHVNRVPFSKHVALQRALGLEVVAEQRNIRPSNIPREKLARRFAELPDQDLITASALIQSRKPMHVEQPAHHWSASP